MHMISKLLSLLVLTLSLASEGMAADWGIGFSAGTAPSLSLQHRYSANEAGHYRAHYSEDALITAFDYQRFLGHNFSFLPNSLEFYSGFGVAGEARKDQGTKEFFHAKIPAGVQWNSASLRASAFLEGAALMGPIPKTSLTGAASGGIRTVF